MNGVTWERSRASTVIFACNWSIGSGAGEKILISWGQHLCWAQHPSTKAPFKPLPPLPCPG